MKAQFIAAGVLSMTASLAQAGGIDRSGQFITDIFQEGRVVKFSFGATNARVSGAGTSDVGQGFSRYDFSYKADLNEHVSLAVIVDQPFGVDVNYLSNPAASVLGGTRAVVDTTAVTAIGRYKFENGFSLHGGLKAQRAEGQVNLNGLAFAAAIGGPYSLDLNSNTGYGWLAGVAYERPDIALRVALTYNSEVDHDFDSVDSRVGNVTTNVSTPESWNLEFQSGVAQNVLVFGSIRYAAYDDFIVPAAGLGGANLASLEDSTDFALGVGYKFNDTWSASAILGHSRTSDDSTSSPLSPIGDTTSLTLAAVYTNEKIKVTTGIRYTRLGDTNAVVGGVPVSSFTDNSALSAGVSIAYSF